MAFCSELAPVVVATYWASSPKRMWSTPAESELELAGLGTLLTRMATFGASPTLVVCGLATPTLRSTHMPEPCRRRRVRRRLGSAGKIRLPAGI